MPWITKLEQDESIIERICEDVRKGHSPNVAALAAGVSDRAFRNWMREGRDKPDSSTAFARLFQSVTRAQAEAEINLGNDAQRGDDKGESYGRSKAALEVLSRRFPKRWAQRVNIKVEQELEELLDVVRGVCAPEDFERVLEEIAARDSEEEA